MLFNLFFVFVFIAFTSINYAAPAVVANEQQPWIPLQWVISHDPQRGIVGYYVVPPSQNTKHYQLAKTEYLLKEYSNERSKIPLSYEQSRQVYFIDKHIHNHCHFGIDFSIHSDSETGQFTTQKEIKHFTEDTEDTREPYKKFKHLILKAAEIRLNPPNEYKAIPGDSDTSEIICSGKRENEYCPVKVNTAFKKWQYQSLQEYRKERDKIPFTMEQLKIINSIDDHKKYQGSSHLYPEGRSGQEWAEKNLQSLREDRYTHMNQQYQEPIISIIIELARRRTGAKNDNPSPYGYYFYSTPTQRKFDYLMIPVFY